jgi:hypothetical protein
MRKRALAAEIRIIFPVCVWGATFDWTKVVEWLTKGDGDDRRGKKRIAK